MLVLAYDARSAMEFGVEDYDAQEDGLAFEEGTVTRLTRPEDATPEELARTPFFASNVRERTLQTVSRWLTLMAIEEDNEKKRREEFARRQLKLPGVE